MSGGPRPYPGVEEQVYVLVQQGLVLLVARTEVLQKLMRQPHYLLHLGVLGLRGRRQREVGWHRAVRRASRGRREKVCLPGQETGFCDAPTTTEGPLWGDAWVLPCSDQKEASQARPVFPRVLPLALGEAKRFYSGKKAIQSGR